MSVSFLYLFSNVPSNMIVLVCTLIRELKPGSMIMQQGLGRVLGAIDYNRFPACLEQSIETLLECVNREVRIASV